VKKEAHPVHERGACTAIIGVSKKPKRRKEKKIWRQSLNTFELRSMGGGTGGLEMTAAPEVVGETRKGARMLEGGRAESILETECPAPNN